LIGAVPILGIALELPGNSSKDGVWGDCRIKSSSSNPEINPERYETYIA